MGRKKKSQVEEPKKEIKVETPVNSVSYTGVINVSLKKVKKLILIRLLEIKADDHYSIS